MPLSFIIILAVIGYGCLIAMIVIKKNNYLKIEWRVHKKQIIKNCDIWIHADMDEFIRRFNKHQWRTESPYKGSFFTPLVIVQNPDNILERMDASNTNHENNKLNYIHADIIKIDGVGLMLDYKSYKQFKKWSYIYNGEKIVQRNIEQKMIKLVINGLTSATKEMQKGFI